MSDVATEALERIEPTLKKAAATLRGAGIPFLIGGSLALWARGGPEYVGDLDVVVKEEDVGRAKEALEAAGFKGEEAPEEWLLKVRDGDTVIDLIHEPTGFKVTDETLARGQEIDVLGMSVPLMALEDIFTTKLLALKEHYLDFEGILPFARALREQVDWNEVRRRTEASPFARAFFTLIEGLEIVSPGAADKARSS